MKYIKLYENYNEEDTVDLYHGTSKYSAEHFIKNGWNIPLYNFSGANGGQSKYLYLTSEIDDAMWFAQEKGEDTIIKVKNIPISYLIFDPEDGDYDREVYKTVENAVRSIKNGIPFPIKLTLTKPLDSKHFEIVNKY